MASKLKTMQVAIEFATELIDQKIRTFADHQAENKRKLDDNSRINQTQQQPYKRQNVARAYTTRPGEKKRAPEAIQRVVPCFECEVQGHYKRDFPKLKNNNRRNPVGNGGAPARAYAVGNAGRKPDSNVVMGTDEVGTDLRSRALKQTFVTDLWSRPHVQTIRRRSGVSSIGVGQTSTITRGDKRTDQNHNNTWTRHPNLPQFEKKSKNMVDSQLGDGPLTELPEEACDIKADGPPIELPKVAYDSK
ncbi:hypothetical protein Tco_1460202, partial [Tanacetum coccineum]